MSIKLAIKQSSEFMLFRALRIVVSLVSFPILTRTFSVAEYGDLSLATVTIALLVALVKCGITSSFIRYDPEHEKEGTTKELYSTSFYGSILITASILILYISIVYGFKTSIGTSLTNTLLILSLVILFRHIENLYHGFFRAQLKVKTLGIIGVINRIGSIGSGLAVYLLVMRSVFGFFIGVGLFELFLTVVVYLAFFRNQISFKYVSGDTLKKLYTFGIPLIFFEISYLILNSSDRYLIKYFLDSTQLGIYSVGYNFSYYFHGLLSMPVGMAIYPIYTKLWTNEGEEKTAEFLNTIFKYYMCLAIFIIFLIIGCGREIIIFLASDKYSDAYKIIPFVISSVLISGAYQITGAGFFLQKKTKAIGFYTMLCAVLNILLNLFFIPQFGIVGAAFTTFVSFIVLAFLITYKSNKILKMYFPIKDILVYSLFGLIMLALLKVVGNNFMLIVSIVVQLLLGSVVYIALSTVYDKNLRNAFKYINPRKKSPAER